MTPEEKFIALMDAAYCAADKETYYKLIQEADEVLKKFQDLATNDDNQAAKK